MIQYVSTGGFILGQTAWEEGRPWLRPDATQYLQNHLPQQAYIFEWGMGASTIWFAKHGHSAISLELNKKWYYQVAHRLIDDNLLAGGLHYFGKIGDMDGEIDLADLQWYADKIMEYKDQEFDLILVDGRNRCRCLANALSKVKIGGMLCLDNSERSEYAKALGLLDTWDGYEWGDSGWKTAIWHRAEYSNITPVIFPNEDA